MKIGERLKQLRKAKKLRQSKIAELLQITTENYSKIENGKIMITVDKLVKVAGFYRVSLDYLVYGMVVMEATENSTGYPSPGDVIASGPGSLVESFGDYSDSIEKMLMDMKDDKPLMHNLLSEYHMEKQKRMAAAAAPKKR